MPRRAPVQCGVTFIRRNSASNSRSSYPLSAPNVTRPPRRSRPALLPSVLVFLVCVVYRSVFGWAARALAKRNRVGWITFDTVSIEHMLLTRVGVGNLLCGKFIRPQVKTVGDYHLVHFAASQRAHLD